MPKTRKKGRTKQSMTGVILTLLVVLAFLVRLWGSSLPGFGPDLGINSGWAHSGTWLGLAESYQHQLHDNMLPDHPPMSIIAYTFVGQFYIHHISDSDDTALLANSIWIRLPAIAADLVTLVFLFLLVFQARGLLLATAVGAAHALNPAIIGDSAIWGQIDSLFTMWIVASLFFFHRKHGVLFAVCYVLAVLSKVQALAILPFMLYLWLFRVPFREQLWGVAMSAVAIGVVLLPFVIGGVMPQVLQTYTGAVGHYPSLSMNAYNLWWLLYPNSGHSSTDTALWYLTYQHMGFILFGCSLAYVITLYHRWSAAKNLSQKAKESYVPLFASASAIFFAFFVLNTEMHERYLLPAVILALPLLAYNIPFACACIALTVLAWLNLTGVMEMFPVDRWIFGTFENMRALIAFLIVTLFGFYMYFVKGAMAIAPRKKVTART